MKNIISKIFELFLGLSGFYAEADLIPLDDIPVRNYFPETWEWRTVKIPSSGEYKLGNCI